MIREGISMEEAMQRFTGNAEDSNEQPQAEPEQVEAEEVETELEETVVSEGEESAEDEIEGESLFVQLGEEEINVEDISKWREGYMKNADYTQKTQALAEERKGLEAKSAETDALSGQLKSVIENLESMIGDKEKATDWEYLRDNDPSEYLRQKEEIESRKIALKEAKTQSELLEQKKFNERIESENALLLKALPSWNDEQAKASDLALMQAYAKDMGYTEADTKDIVNHKHWLAILDAAKFRELQKNGSETTKKVKKSMKVVKPGKSQAKSTGLDAQLAKAKERHKKQGTVESAMAVKKLQKEIRSAQQ